MTLKQEPKFTKAEKLEMLNNAIEAIKELQIKINNLPDEIQEQLEALENE
jgi:hypothetical protein